MNNTITLQAPELVGALNNLAASLGGNAMATLQGSPQQPVAASQQPPMQSVYGTAPAPVAQAQAALPVTPPQAAPVGIPTTAPTYTLQQLSGAAGPIVDANRSGELTSWLQQRGVHMLTQLPQELYGEFATYLRSLGAKI